MIGELLEVGTKLSEASDRLQQAGVARRKSIADYFLKIEECLRESVEQLKKGQVPNSKWGELKVYAQKLPMTIGREIGEETAQELSFLLFSTARNMPTDKDIPSIETAAGKFRGLANTITTQQASDPARRKVFTYTAIGVVGLASGLLLDKFRRPQTDSPSTGSQYSGTDQFPSISWEMHTFLRNNVERTILFNAPQHICDRVKSMTQDRFKITLKRTGETEEILKKVSDGSIQCGYSGIYYSTPQYKALFFGCAIPFGLNPQEQTAWLNYKKNPDDELTFMQSIYREKLNLNVIPFPAGATGGQMGGWFKAKINSLDDLKGKIIRIPGLGADVFKELGMKTHDEFGNVQINEAIQKLKEGIYFAVEWTSPYDDLQLGLDKAAKFYYYPGWWEPSTTFDVQVNIDAWRKLPSNYQEIFKLACRETYINTLTDYDQKNSFALEEIQQKKDVELLRFNEDVLKAAKEETKKLLDLYATNNVVFKEVYDEWRNFKKKIQAWSNLTKIE